MPFPLFSEKGINAKKEALRKAEQLTVRLRTRRSHILRWAVGALDWYHSIWFLNCSLDDYFNRADCDPDLLPALRAFGEPLRAVCLLRSEQAQAAKVCMFSGIEKPSPLTDRTSDRSICFYCTIYCLFHAYLSFLIPCLTSILYADNPLLEQNCLERLRQTHPRSGGACSNMQNRIDDGPIIQRLISYVNFSFVELYAIFIDTLTARRYNSGITKREEFAWLLLAH